MILTEGFVFNVNDSDNAAGYMLLVRLFLLFLRNGTASTTGLSFNKAIKLNGDCFVAASVDEEGVASAPESAEEFSTVAEAPTATCKLRGIK